MGFLPLRLLSKDLGVHRDSNSQSESSLESMKVRSFTFSYIPKSMKCDSQASFLARTLVNLYLGREPKARVATITSIVWFSIQFSFVRLSVWDNPSHY
jgi:hypothetical protein